MEGGGTSLLRSDMLTSQQAREMFWRTHTDIQKHRRSRKRFIDYPCRVMCAWAEFVVKLRNMGKITERQADTMSP